MVSSGNLFWSRVRAFMLLQLNVYQTYPFRLTRELLGGGLSLIGIYFLSQIVSGPVFSSASNTGGSYLAFACIGFVVNAFATLGAKQPASWIRQAQGSGTLESMLQTGLSLKELLLFANLFPLCMMVLRVFVYLTVAFWVMDIALSWTVAFAILIVVGLTLVTFLGFGLLGACFVLLYRREPPFLGTFMSISTLLSGVLYPIEILPGFLQAIAQLLPLSHALTATRGVLFEGSPIMAVLPPALVLAIMSGLLYPLVISLTQKALAKARHNGVIALH